MTGSGEELSLRLMFVSAKPAPLDAFSAHDLLFCSTSTRMKASTHCMRLAGKEKTSCCLLESDALIVQPWTLGITPSSVNLTAGMRCCSSMHNTHLTCSARTGMDGHMD